MTIYDYTKPGLDTFYDKSQVMRYDVNNNSII